MSRVPRSACPCCFGAPIALAHLEAIAAGRQQFRCRSASIRRLTQPPLNLSETRATQPVAAPCGAELESPEWAAPRRAVSALATRLAGRWEVGEDAGLGPLVAAVERAQAVSQGRARVSFSVRPARGAAFGCTGYEGMSLKEVAEHAEDEGASTLAEHLECACSGVMACSTCHIYVDSEWVEAVGRPTEEEEDMLDLAFERRENSRLGCQLVLRSELDGLKIAVPSSANNMFDYIPFGDKGDVRFSKRSLSDSGEGRSAAVWWWGRGRTQQPRFPLALWLVVGVHLKSPVITLYCITRL